MAIIDLDSHLRDGWLLDEIYQLPEPYAKYSPRRISDGGKALIDFFLGEENARILAKAGEFATRKGIHPPVPDADKIQGVEMDDFDANEFKEKSRELQKIFLK